jgi:phage/conjugal plasmid C-4 type zinc finger TraR family protein
MAVGWSKDGALNEQIDSTVEEALDRVRRQLPRGASLEICESCGREIPQARREAVPGVRLCVTCQAELERE